MSAYFDAIRQCVFIPKPTFAAAQLPDQTGRVFIVTGGYTGCGKELCKILYARNGTVYIAGRAESKFTPAAEEIRHDSPSSDGRLEFLHLDLADLESVKKAAEEFARKEQRLDVLTNNAGVMIPPAGSKSAQNHELQMGTNCLGPWFFTDLLLPLLKKTAASSDSPGSVRVTWAASMATMMSPKHGVEFGPDSTQPKTYNRALVNYAQSKAGNVLLAQEFQRRHGDEAGIASLAWNPGNLASELYRHQGMLESLFTRLVLYPSYLGGLTELYAGWSEEAGKKERGGGYVGPWGRFAVLRSDLDQSQAAGRFWEWCERESGGYRQ